MLGDGFFDFSKKLKRVLGIFPNEMHPWKNGVLPKVLLSIALLRTPLNLRSVNAYKKQLKTKKRKSEKKRSFSKNKKTAENHSRRFFKNTKIYGGLKNERKNKNAKTKIVRVVQN